MKHLTLQNGSVALVDDEDYEELSKFKWYADKRPRSCYVRRLEKNNTPEGPRQRCIYLHRQIMKPPPGMDVDHINSDALDNRREKLHIGVFDSELSAASAYDQKAKELFGQYAKLNIQ